MKVTYHTVGEHVDRLANWLGGRGLAIESVTQTSFMRGIIIADVYGDPDELIGVGINDGTRIMRAEWQREDTSV